MLQSLHYCNQLAAGRRTLMIWIGLIQWIVDFLVRFLQELRPMLQTWLTNWSDINNMSIWCIPILYIICFLTANTDAVISAFIISIVFVGIRDKTCSGPYELSVFCNCELEWTVLWLWGKQKGVFTKWTELWDVFLLNMLVSDRYSSSSSGIALCFGKENMTSPVLTVKTIEIVSILTWFPRHAFMLLSQ